MNFDPENRVVKLCAEGMQAEAKGELDAAKKCFDEAWSIASDDFERFTAAHFLARAQTDAQLSLQWNLDTLKYANAIDDESTRSHYPSLYLNVAKSYETLNDITEANKNYQLASDYSNFLPAGGYGDLIKSGISAGLQRTDSGAFKNAVIDELVEGWCARKELRPLALVLPAYLQNLGTYNDKNKLISALSLLSAARCLSDDDQRKVNNLIAELSITL